MKAVLKSISVIITILVLARFLALFSFVGPEFGFATKVGSFVPGWLLGIVGLIVNIWLSEGICELWKEIDFFRACAVLCAVVLLLDLFVMYIVAQI